MKFLSQIKRPPGDIYVFNGLEVVNQFQEVVIGRKEINQV